MEYSQELITPDKDIPFKMFLFEGMKGNYVREKHWHREVEIFAVFQGDLEFEIQDRTYALQPGEFILVNTNEVHSINAPNQNMTLVFQIPLSFFENYMGEERLIYFSHDVHEKDGEIMSLLKEMYSAYNERKTAFSLQVLSLFYRLLYLLISRYRKHELDPVMIRQNRSLNRLSRITDYMQDNYMHELTLEEVAKTFSYSPTYVAHMFRQYAKTTFKKYLAGIRLEYAFRRINETEESLNDIAMDTGFAGSKALAHVFQEKYGILPSEYRRRQRR